MDVHVRRSPADRGSVPIRVVPRANAEDSEACLVADAAEIDSYDPTAACALLMKALHADLRCIDAHSHLGNQVFDRRPEDAITHYDIAIGIGDL